MAFPVGYFGHEEVADVVVCWDHDAQRLHVSSDCLGLSLVNGSPSAEEQQSVELRVDEEARLVDCEDDCAVVPGNLPEDVEHPCRLVAVESRSWLVKDKQQR